MIYKKTHPWITFNIDLKPASPHLWLALGEAQSKCEHIAGIPLRPDTAEKLHRLYLAKGAFATTAIEGNTLSEEEVLKSLDGTLHLPRSREYLIKEIQNILSAFGGVLEPIKKGEIVPLSSDLLAHFNSQILSELAVGEDVIPGEIRKDSRVVGRYRCPPPEDCPYLVNEFCKWMNGTTFATNAGNEIVYGIIKAIVAHIYFVWIHPFGDGNGRTARLLELKFLMESGVPSDAAHLLSNYYNLTRTEYYRQLDVASKSGGDLLPFIQYAVTGFVEQLKEQIDVIREQQIDVTWTNFVHTQFRNDNSNSGKRRRTLVLALSKADKPVPKAQLSKLTADLAADYAKKTPKTISRDINALVEMDLIKLIEGGYKARKNMIRAFLPIRKPTQQKKKRQKATDNRQMLLFGD